MLNGISGGMFLYTLVRYVLGYLQDERFLKFYCIVYDERRNIQSECKYKKS